MPKKRKKIFIILLSLLVGISMVAGLSSNANAAGDKKVKLYAYFSHSTSFPGYYGYSYKKWVRFKENGKNKKRDAYCLQPNVVTPRSNGTTRTADKISDSGKVGKVLYFVKGAPGEEDFCDYLEKHFKSVSNPDSDSFYAFCHMVLSYAYQGSKCFTGYGSCSEAAKNHVKDAYKWIQNQTIVTDPDFTVHTKAGSEKTVTAEEAIGGNLFSTEKSPFTLDGKGSQYFYLKVPKNYTLHLSHKKKGASKATQSTYKSGKKVKISNHDSFWFEIKGTKPGKKTFTVEGEQGAIDAYRIVTKGLQDVGFFMNEETAKAKFTLKFPPSSPRKVNDKFSFRKMLESIDSDEPPEEEDGATFRCYYSGFSSYEEAVSYVPTEEEAKTLPAGNPYGMATSEDGLVEMTNLWPGTYVVEQTGGDPRYEFCDRFLISTATSADDFPEIIDKAKDLTLQIIKRNERNNQVVTLSGAVFEISDSGGEVVATVTTDSSGVAKVEGLKRGETYTITEKAAPSGYQLNKNSKEITLDEDEPDNVVFSADGMNATADFEDLPDVKIHTSASCPDTQIQQGPVEAQSKIKDVVHCENLRPGEVYTIVGRVMNKKTQKEMKVGKGEGTKTFVATEYDMDIEMDYTIDSTDMKNKDTVVFEKLYSDYNGEDKELKAKHEDYSDEGQTIHYPDIHTEAEDALTQDHVGSYGKTIIFRDSVSYENLIPGKTYKMSGTLIDKKTGKPLVQNGKEVTAEKTFTPADKDGMVELEFTVDSTKLQGKTIVAFEKLGYNGVELVTHEKINDEGQTIHYPRIGTKAHDSVTLIQSGRSKKDAVIIDKVSFENLIPGLEYKMEGYLMEKNEIKPIEQNGKKITGENSFVPEKSSGTVEIRFNVDASVLRGKDIVVYENLYHNNANVGKHENINDEGQTVHYPDIRTTATDTSTGEGVGKVSKEATVKDVVAYRNLIPGKEYKMRGKLILKDENKTEIKLMNGETTVEKKFVPDKKDGSVELFFTFDSSQLAGKDVVAFEKCLFDDTELVEHEDYDDEGQTVHFPEIGTKALVDGDQIVPDSVDKKHVTLVDTVEYRNLVPNKVYKVRGTLINKQTGEAVKNDDKDVTSEAEFTPSKKDGAVEVIFTFDASELSGQETVAFETLSRKDVDLRVHADIEDEGQTVYFPEIHTSAIDTATKDKVGHEDKKITIRDTVAYKALKPGKTYTMSGKLMDKETGEPLLNTDGNEIAKETTFTPDNTDGFMTIDFELDSSLLKGKTIVAFEKCSDEKRDIAVHEDINDEDQSIHFPEIRTKAKDRNTNSQIGMVAKKNLVEDTVSYTNLIPGNEYTIKGILMDKETGEPLIAKGDKVTAERTFTPTVPSGSIKLLFKVDSSVIKGKTTVVFERIFHNDVELTTHEDIEDEGQTVYFSKIHTTATVNGKHTAKPVKKTTLLDKVEYKNLMPGRKYTLKGKIVDRATNRPLKINGKLIQTKTTFTPESPDGEVTLDFKLDGTAVEGHKLVVFEKLFYNGKEINKHENLEDEDQSVYIKNIPVVKHSTPAPHYNSPVPVSKTGDMIKLGALIAGFIAGIVFVLFRRKRRL